MSVLLPQVSFTSGNTVDFIKREPVVSPDWQEDDYFIIHIATDQLDPQVMLDDKQFTAYVQYHEREELRSKSAATFLKRKQFSLVASQVNNGFYRASREYGDTRRILPKANLDQPPKQVQVKVGRRRISKPQTVFLPHAESYKVVADETFAYLWTKSPAVTGIVARWPLSGSHLIVLDGYNCRPTENWTLSVAEDSQLVVDFVCGEEELDIVWPFIRDREFVTESFPLTGITQSRVDAEREMYFAVRDVAQRIRSDLDDPVDAVESFFCHGEFTGAAESPYGYTFPLIYRDEFTMDELISSLFHATNS